MVFGADGNLYVASGNWFTSSNGPFYSGDFPAGAVLRFEGPSGPNPGAFLGTIVAGGSGGLANPNGILFGPNGNLFVASSLINNNSGNLLARPHTSQVLRYDGATGAFLGAFVTADSGGLKDATFLTFTKTNPTTLNYVTLSAAPSLSPASAVGAASARNLAPLASSLLNTGQPAVPADLLPRPAVPSAAPRSPSSQLPAAETSSHASAGTTDAISAASHARTSDDGDWVLAPLSSGSSDANCEGPFAWHPSRPSDRLSLSGIGPNGKRSGSIDMAD
jgi:hypothetical protein